MNIKTSEIRGKNELILLPWSITEEYGKMQVYQRLNLHIPLGAYETIWIKYRIIDK